MFKILLTIIVLIGWTDSLSATPEAYIKINTHECLKCYAAQIYTDKLVEHVRITIVFPGNFNRYRRFLRMQYPVKTSNYTIIQSDSLYHALGDQELSYFYLQDDSVELYSCQMKEFSRNYPLIIGLINGELSDYTDVELPDTLSFDNVTLLADNENFIAFNRTMQELLVYNGSAFYYLSPEKIDVLALYKFFDKNGEFRNQFLTHQELLESVGKSRAEISAVNIDAQRALVLVQIPYAFMQDNGNLGVKVKLFIAQIALDSYDVRWVFIDDSTVPDRWNVIVSQPTLAYQQGDMVITLSPTDYSDGDFRYLADFVFKKDTLVFSKLLDYRIPEFHQNSGRYYNYLTPKSSHGLIFHQFASNVIDLCKDSVFYLPIENSKLEINLEKLQAEYDLAFTDVITQNNSCKFLYKKQEQGWFLGIVEGGILSYEEIKYLDDTIMNLSFADYNHIVWYDPKRNEVSYRMIP